MRSSLSSSYSLASSLSEWPSSLLSLCVATGVMSCFMGVASSSSLMSSSMAGMGLFGEGLRMGWRGKTWEMCWW